MDTFPFHWDTLDAPQCLRMACLCPDQCHEHLALPQVTLFHILIGNWFRSVSFPPMSITTPPPELISILIHIDFSAWKVSSYTVALLLIQNVRASEELPKISFPGTEYCCSTLSDEGVCNTIVLVGQTRFVSCSTISYEGVCNIFRDSNNNVYELSYPLR